MSVKNEHDLTRAAVAYGLDVDDRTVSRYQDRADRPLPVKERRRTKAGNRYDLRDVIAWAVEDALAKVCTGSDGNRYDYAAERARLTKAQADKTELEVAELRGDLISTPDALVQVEAMMMGVRTKLLALPVKVASQVAATPAEMVKLQESIRVQIYEALEELASDAFAAELHRMMDQNAGGPGADGN